MRAMSRWERKTLHHRLAYTRLRSWIGGLKSQKHFKHLGAFVIFIGYPRSGHSLIGSLLDAHPQAVVSNQLNVLSLIKHNYSKDQITYLIRENTIKEARLGRSNTKYTHYVPNQWQGKHREIKIIGDKRGGSSSRILGNQGQFDILCRLEELMQLPLKIIHVVRNPFDNITTMISRSMQNSGQPFSEQLWQEKMEGYFEKVRINNQLISANDFEVLTVQQEAFIAAPAATLKTIHTFLDLPLHQDNLADCASIVWKQPNRSSTKVDFWTEERIAKVYAQSSIISFLANYQWAESLT